MIKFKMEGERNMYRVAIVEDEWEHAENLYNCLNKYSAEYGVEFNISRHKNGLDFLSKLTPELDLVFMDVDMPHMNGFETAKRMREVAPSAVIIFVTFLAKYAIRGYEVKAFDYIIKPVTYNALKIKIESALSACDKNSMREVMLPISGGMMKIDLSCLKYVEIIGHDIIYHTSQGDQCYYGTMRTVEKLLQQGISYKSQVCIKN